MGMQLSHSDVDGWEQARAKERLFPWSCAFCGLLVVIALALGVIAIAQTRYFAGGYYSSLALTVISMNLQICSAFVLRRRLTSQLQPDVAHGFVVRPARSHVVSATAFYLLTTVTMTLATIGIPTDRIDLDTSTRSGRLLALTAPVLAVIFAGTSLAFALRLLRFPRIEATSQTLTLRSSSSQQTTQWADITAIDTVIHLNCPSITIRAARRTRGDVIPFALGRLVPNSDEPPVTRVDIFPTGALPLVLLLRFYLEHPEARDELDDGRAYERLLTIATPLDQ